jgi:hypothetical protein
MLAPHFFRSRREQVSMSPKTGAIAASRGLPQRALAVA